MSFLPDGHDQLVLLYDTKPFAGRIFGQHLGSMFTCALDIAIAVSLESHVTFHPYQCTLNPAANEGG